MLFNCSYSQLALSSFKKIPIDLLLIEILVYILPEGCCLNPDKKGLWALIIMASRQAGRQVGKMTLSFQRLV